LPVIPKEYREYQTSNLDDAYEQGWNDLQKCIESLPSAQQWIPCSERLPHSQEDVLCDDDGRVTIGYYIDEEIGWHDTHSYRIYPTAWMPLPEPYAEEPTDT